MHTAPAREPLADGPGAPGTAGPASASPSISSLQTEVRAVHAKVKELTAERERLALPSLQGDDWAKVSIAAIDQQRVQLLARKETAEAAIRALQQEHRTTGWRQFLPHLRRCFRAELSQQWELWPGRLEQLLLGRQSHDVVALREALREFDALEATTARLVADRVLPEQRVLYRAGDQDELIRARHGQAKLNEQRQQQVAAAAAELIGDTASLKRPTALDEALAKARVRLDAGATR